ncbi:uncharacterized protein LOC113306183 [Papaver somniferum]|uniref:uncharacterized protein LOC113306183 n=1 Tax=Papaver somniferum TaxID=3469 RepID=UPI000E7029F5|nr:uncharacterized protein LOC113306183 [Papaver somniferum]
MTLKDVADKATANEAAINQLKSDFKSLSTDLTLQIDTLKASFKETLQENNRNLIQLLSKSNIPNRPEDAGGSHHHDDDNSNYFHQHHSAFVNHHHRIPKLDFPRFNEENPRGWIQKSERYFQLNDIEEHRKVDIAAIYLEGKAEKWCLNFQVNRNKITWQDLSTHLCARFENPVEENFVGSFNKLVQTNFVDEYYEEFESLKALVFRMNPSLSESYFGMSFLSGLKDDIGKSVSMFHPQTLANAFSLARLQEQKLQLVTPSPRPFSKSFITPYNSNRTYSPGPLPPKPIITSPKSNRTTPKSFFTPPLKSAPTHTIIKRLTQEEMDKRRAQGLCYNCDADTEGEEDIFEEAPESPIQSDVEISLHALTGSATGETIRIPGITNKKTVSVLIDTGSTTSFIYSKLVSSLQCTITPTPPMKVTVANGDQTTSLCICSKLQWSMQGHKFVEDLRVLPLGSCDIVLGADWLKQLGDVLFNFAKLSISFHYNNKKITLQGTTPKHSFLMMSSETEPSTFPPKRSLDHSIPLQPLSSPINQRAYKCSKLNSITIKDKFPIPIVDELLDELQGSVIFSKIDLRAGYHQIRVHEQDIHKTAFRTHQGHYEFKFMPFGLTNAPATLQALMNEIFQPYLRKFVLVFFDDILIYSHSMSEQLDHLRLFFSLLRQYHLFAKMYKCCFGQPSLEYFGHIVTAEGVSADPTKIACMQSWPVPKNIEELRGFLGLTGYYRKFVQHCGAISKPLTNLLKKNSFLWSSAATTAFEALKLAMSTTPVLALPDFTNPFVVESDASDLCIGVVLLQEGKPIAYFSKPLGPRARALSTYEKEFLAIVLAVQRWRQYLQGHKFNIRTDHQSIHYFLNKKITTSLQQKYLIKLLGFDYEIQYKKGTANIVVDALYRRPMTEAAFNAISLSTPSWIQDVIHSYDQDHKAAQIISQLLLQADSVLISPTKKAS